MPRIIAAALFAFAVAGCVLPSTQRAHEANLAKAKEFKEQFDREYPVGTSIEAVDRWRRRRPPEHLERDFVSVNEADGAGEIRVELAKENYPMIGCGMGSVGLILHFADNKLAKSEAGSWSFDCV